MTIRLHTISTALLLALASLLCSLPLKAQSNADDMQQIRADSIEELSANHLRDRSKQLYKTHQPLGITYTKEHYLVIATDWMLRPYSFVNNNGEYTGFHIDLLRSIFDNLHIPYSFRMMNRNKARQRLAKGEVHLMIDTYHGNSPGTIVYGSRMIGKYNINVMHLKNVVHIGSLPSLTKNDTIYMKEHSYGAYFFNEEYKGKRNFHIAYMDPMAAHKEIINGKIKYFIYDEEALKELTRRYGTRSMMNIDPVDIPPRKFRFVGTDSLLINELDQQLIRLMNNGTYDEIYNKWFSDIPPKSESKEKAEIVTVVSLIGFVVLFFFLYIFTQRGYSLTRLRDEFRAVSNIAISLTGSHVIVIDVRKMRVFPVYGDFIPPEGIDYADYEAMIHPDDRHKEINSRKVIDNGKTDMPVLQIRFRRYKDTYNTTKDDWRQMDVIAYIKGARKSKKPQYIYLVLVDKTDLIEETRYFEKVSGEYLSVSDISDMGTIYFDKAGRSIANEYVIKMFSKGGKGNAEEYLKRMTANDFFQLCGGLTLNTDDNLWVCSRIEVAELNLFSAVEIRMQRITNEQQELVGYAVSIIDQTERRQKIRELNEHNDYLTVLKSEISRYQTELRFIMHRSKMHSFRWQVGTDYLEFSRRLFSFDIRVPIRKYYEAVVETDCSEYEDLLKNPARYFAKPIHVTRKYRAFQNESEDISWHTVDVMPEYDRQGHLCGAFGMLCEVTDYMATQESLKLVNEESKESMRQKNLFLANMTHELRTPLNAISGFAELLRASATPQERQEYVGIMAHNCTMLIAIIDNILELSAMDSDGISVQPELVDFAVEFPKEVGKLSHYITKLEVSYIIDRPLRSLPVVVDMQRIMQIMDALVNNASKFTSEGFVRVGYRYTAGRLTIYCRDSGCGIPKERRSEIFSRFVKLHDHAQGTGLGLSICNMIASSMGTTIDVFTREGEGTTMSFSLKVED